MIRARAPGKVVLWGEYAVLAGAPALVMAVDRYAVCEVESGGDAWRFCARGFAAPPETLSRARLLARDAPAPGSVSLIAWHAARLLPPDRLPAGATVNLDTSTFQHRGNKLGLGSSAALGVAVFAALARLCGQVPSDAQALALHRQFQGGAGSGIDVAAAWHGGTLRFQRPAGDAAAPPEVAAWPLPDACHLCFVYSGQSASTPQHLERFRRWRERAAGSELDELIAASAAMFDAPDLLAALARYVLALQSLDEAAGLGVFSAPHRRLAQLAIDAGVVYKPCGAGGGDLGAAFAPDADAAGRFARLAADNAFLPLALETAPHGIQVTG